MAADLRIRASELRRASSGIVLRPEIALIADILPTKLVLSREHSGLRKYGLQTRGVLRLHGPVRLPQRRCDSTALVWLNIQGVWVT